MRAQGEVAVTHGREILHWWYPFYILLVLLVVGRYHTGVQKLHWCVYFVWLGVIPVVATFYQVSFIGHTSANKPSLHCHHHNHHHHHQPDQPDHHLYVRADLARCMGELVIGQARQWQVDNRETQVDHIRLTRTHQVDHIKLKQTHTLS